MRREHAHPVVVLLTVLALVAGCGSSAGPSPSAPPDASPGPAGSPAASTLPPTAPPVASPSLSPSPTPDPFVGQVAVTVSDNLVVRSQPRVSDDSTMYKPWLPVGTALTVLDGPVRASGYTWYKVAPVSFAGLSGPGYGWVAMAGKDGEAWIALATTELPGGRLAMSNVPRTSVAPAEAKKAAAAITAFGLDLYRRMLADGTLGPKENAVFSPTSIILALAMARAGAKGATAAQMDAAMRSAGADSLAGALNALDRALASRTGTFDIYGETKGDVILRQANSVFAQRDLLIERTLLDALASRFGAGVRLVDFRADAEAARRAINAWVKQQTRGRIPDLLQPIDVTTATRLALVNALYLKAPWENPFQRGDTKPGSFTRLDGSRVSVPMMNLVQCQGLGLCSLPYAAGSGWRAVELPLLADQETGGLAMTIIVPTNLGTFEKTLTPKAMAGIVGALRTEPPGQQPCSDCPGTVYDVHLTMPRFGIDTRFNLASVLKAAGMPLAFDQDRADFTGIASPPDGPLFIKNVIHEANIDVDEKGVTASAATAVVMATGGGPNAKVITFKVDRPFLFLLRDVPTGAVLFMGRVVDPSAK